MEDEVLGSLIFIIRGQKVMMDSDLAKLYGVETKVLNQAVKRNIDRFPEDFMFLCENSELDNLRSQFVTANPASRWNYKRRSSPMLFTENGIAMLSSVINSKRAIQVNIAIMRTFTKLRSFLMLEKELTERVSRFEEETRKTFQLVFERMDQYQKSVEPHLDRKRKKIGIKK